ncbi:MAG: extracellular solute-binding protein [Mesorhizobium sp.]
MLRLTSLALAGLAVVSTSSFAQDDWQTSPTLIRPTKYQPFERYDYVNPDAPKGGTANKASVGTFNSFNPFIVKGLPPAAGLTQTGGILYDTLMSQSTDEPGVAHPLIAEAMKHPADYSSATYRINPAARWHDGQPITAEDVVWSFEQMRKLNPLYIRYYANVKEAKAISEREVKFTFDQTGNRELPHIMGDLVVLPRHWWEGTDSNGKKRSIEEPTLEPPLGSGPYKIESFKAGTDITWVRVADYWAKDLPVNVGRNNFERRKFIYFLDEAAAWTAFVKGGIDDYRFENRAQRWATEYNFPAFTAGDVVKDPLRREAIQPMQGYLMNTRLPKFSDRRVREAITWAFDFENLNRTAFYNLYTRSSSYFQGSELASTGLPQGEELAILEPFKDKLPPELFTQEFKLPVYGTREAQRDNLRRATQLLAEAGWKRPEPIGFVQKMLSWIGLAEGQLDERFLVNDRRERLSIEFLGNDPSDDRIILPFVESLKSLGIDASLRIVDPAQYENRKRDFEFDMTVGSFVQSSSPGNEQRTQWGSQAARIPGSDNLMGISDPVVDSLVERVVFTKDRDDLVAATRALDRVLLWNYYLVPQWYNPDIFFARWTRIARPAGQPGYAGADPASWWIDESRAKVLDDKYKEGG